MKITGLKSISYTNASKKQNFRSNEIFYKDDKDFVKLPIEEKLNIINKKLNCIRAFQKNSLETITKNQDMLQKFTRDVFEIQSPQNTTKIWYTDRERPIRIYSASQ